MVGAPATTSARIRVHTACTLFVCIAWRVHVHQVRGNRPRGPMPRVYRRDPRPLRGDEYLQHGRLPERLGALFFPIILGALSMFFLHLGLCCFLHQVHDASCMLREPQLEVQKRALCWAVAGQKTTQFTIVRSYCR